MHFHNTLRHIRTLKILSLELWHKICDFNQIHTTQFRIHSSITQIRNLKLI